MADISEHVVDAYMLRCLDEAAARLAVPSPIVELRKHPVDSERVVLLARSPHGQVVTYAPMRFEGELGTMGRFVTVEDEHGSLQTQAIEQSVELVGAGALHVRADGSSWLEAGMPSAALLTLDACVVSLFENHVRAVTDLPLGAPTMHGRVAAASHIGWAPGLHGALRHCMARDPKARIHLYGIEGVAGMRIGHVCVVSEEADDAVRRAQHAAEYLTGMIEE